MLDSQMMKNISVIQLLAVFGTVLTATYTPNRANSQFPGGDVADSSFRWRLAPDDGGLTQNNGKQGSLDVKGLYKRVLLDLGQDKVLLETENTCAECQLRIDQRTNEHDGRPVFPNRFQDTQSRKTLTNIDESSLVSSTSDETLGLRTVPFSPYSLNVGEVRTVKLQNGGRIRITASKPAPQADSFIRNNFPSKSGPPLPSFSPKISGAPTKQGLIQIGPKMYVRVTANKPPPPPPSSHSSVFQSRIQQDRFENLRPLPPVTRPPLTQGVYDFYATTEQPCEVPENELPLTPEFSTGSVQSRLDVRTDIRTNLPVSPFAVPNQSSRVNSRLSETSTSDFSSKTLNRAEAERPSGLPVSPFPVGPSSSRVDSRLSETSSSDFTSKTLNRAEEERPSGLPVSPFPIGGATESESSRTDSRFSETARGDQGQIGGTSLPVSPFPSGAAGGKQDVIESNTVEISPGKYVRINATKGPDAPSRGYIPPYRSLAPPTRPPLTQGVADHYSQSSGTPTQGSQESKSAEGSAPDSNKKLIQIGPGKYIRVTAQKDKQKP